MSIVEKMIPTVPNPTQYSHNPSFLPETTEGEKIVSDELVPTLPAPPFYHMHQLMITT